MFRVADQTFATSDLAPQVKFSLSLKKAPTHGIALKSYTKFTAGGAKSH